MEGACGSDFLAGDKNWKEELLNGSIDLESDEMMVRLMRDIPGEAG